MSASLVIESGIAAGMVHWIDRGVVRIGSDVGMDLTIPSELVPPHGVTLEFRDGGYVIHNRSAKPIYLGGHPLPPKSASAWSDSDLLDLGDGIQLSLSIDGDPSPSPRPRDAPIVRPAATIEDTATIEKKVANQHATRGAVATSKKSSSTMLQIVVIVFCVIMGGLLIARDQMKSDAPVSQDLPRFSDLVDATRQSDLPIAHDLLPHLQYAEAAVIRGDRKAAKQRITRLREKILAAEVAAITGGELSDSESNVLLKHLLHWTEHRLESLDGL